MEVQWPGYLIGLMISFSEENYLKAIFHLQRKFPAGVSTNALAEEMSTKASSVTDMVKKLSEKELVNYKKYQGVKISKKGEKAAVEVVRKHRLWEVFLVEKLNFSWAEVHEVAEQLEHIQSEKLVLELDKLLGFPQKDPHGDPIPDRNGNFTTSDKILLSELEVGKNGLFVGVKDSSREFLEYLDKNQISLGKEISVRSREPFDQSLVIEIDGKKIHISRAVSNNLFIKAD